MAEEDGEFDGVEKMLTGEEVSDAIVAPPLVLGVECGVELYDDLCKVT